MLPEVVAATNALDALAKVILNTWSDQPYSTANGNNWSYPAMKRDDMAARCVRLSNRLKAIPDNQVDASLKKVLSELPAQLAWFQSQTLQQVSGNAFQVLANLELLASNVESALPVDRMPDWTTMMKSDLVPRDLARRVRSLEAALKRLEPKTGDLEEQVERINSAHAAALDLPTDLQSLSEARTEIASYADEVRTHRKAVSDADAVIQACARDIKDRSDEADKLIANINAAYSAATTVGLAASFTESAKRLNRSTWIWVLLLFVSLVAGGVLGYFRLQSIQQLLATPNARAEFVWLNAVLSLFSIAAPVWFAWVATRQISQRFRLAEDYGFKASVARAYEGFRKEAARLDPEFEARLFSSALDRLDEAPLRFLSLEEHSSPYEALLAAPGFQKVVEKFPDIKETVREIAKATRGKQPKKAVSTVSDDPVPEVAE